MFVQHAMSAGRAQGVLVALLDLSVKLGVTPSARTNAYRVLRKLCILLNKGNCIFGPCPWAHCIQTPYDSPPVEPNPKQRVRVLRIVNLWLLRERDLGS